jgi:hypothetical protein
MVGPGLRKNPVHDVLSASPLWIHPDSQYQFLGTADVARIVWRLVGQGRRNEIFNVCGEGLVSPREVARMAGRTLDLSRVSPRDAPRVVEVSVEKLQSNVGVPTTLDTIRRFLAQPGGAR